MRNRTIESEKPSYMPTMTANDAYEQDMLQHSLARSDSPEHQRAAQVMERTFHYEAGQVQEMQTGREYSLS